MIEEKNNKKNIKIKSFNNKWYEFLIAYGIINLYFFSTINTAATKLHGTFLELYINEPVYVDGADFSIFGNLLGAPLFLFFVLANIFFILVQQIVIILIFKYVYFKSIVEAEEKAKLYHHIKIAIICFLLTSIIGAMFWGSILRVVFFIFSYLPLLFFTFIFICLKMKKLVREEWLKAL